MKGTLIHICNENDVPMTAAQLRDYSPAAYAVLEGELAGGDAVCREAGGAEPAEFSRIVKFRLHTGDDDEPGTIFPRPGGEWRESVRQLVWHVGPGGEPRNCSVITYAKHSAPAPSVSVVISTYNQPEWLEKTLWGYLAQQYRDFEIIVADDGSGYETFLAVERLRPLLFFPVKHVWHSDMGFRKCTILNKAILAAGADYLLFSDGDCIPRADFVATHMRSRAPKRFLSNGYYKLDMHLSKLISPERDILAGRCFDIKWLRAHGLPRTFKNNKFTAKGLKRKLLNTFTPAKASWNGHGASAWLADILAANGFDQRMKYGGEDRELGERLENAGIFGKQIRYSTVCLHLDHSRGYVAPGDVERNDALRCNTRRFRVKRTPFGIYRDE